MPHDHSCHASCGCAPAQDHGPRPAVRQDPPDWRPSAQIKTKAIAIFQRDDQILAAPVYDDAKKIKGWRPLGGSIEFGETAQAALIREMHEETGQTITDLTQIAVLENLYTHHGAPGHEVVFVFTARFTEAAIYEADLLTFTEADYQDDAKWISVPKAKAGRLALYPEGLADLL